MHKYMCLVTLSIPSSHHCHSDFILCLLIRQTLNTLESLEESFISFLRTDIFRPWVHWASNSLNKQIVFREAGYHPVLIGRVYASLVRAGCYSEPRVLSVCFHLAVKSLIFIILKLSFVFQLFLTFLTSAK